MKKIDLLFNSKKNAHICNDYLDDIEFNCFRKLLSDDEYAIFSRVMSKPLYDLEKVKERQNIFRDLLTYSSIGEKLKSICDEAQKNKMPKYDLVYRSTPEKRKIVDYFKIITRTFDVQSELLSVVKDRKFVSSTLIKFRNQLYVDDEINKIKEKLHFLVKNIVKENISLQINFGKTFKLRTASVYSSGHKVTINKKKIFQKKENHKGSSYGHDFIADIQIGNMINSGINNISYIMYQLNSHILTFCRELSSQLSFYMAGIKIIKYFQNIGININFPKVYLNNEHIHTKGLYDVGLIIKRDSCIDVIPNDFIGEKGYFYLISGVNQGGKTTFLKSIGTAQLFAQNGLPVIAKEYSCPLFESLVTHFPRGEDEQQYSGKLEEELSRLKHDLPLMIKKSLILMNESFATTTEKEGADIASDTLKALSFVKPMVLFVTHNYILLKKRNEYSREFKNNISFRSLVTIKGNSPSERTYRLVEGKPQEEIDTIEFLKGKYIK